MGWFDEQIRQRVRNDAEVFEESFLDIADSVLGSRATAALRGERMVTRRALDEILKYYQCKHHPHQLAKFSNYSLMNLCIT